ncbi:hypothetical protein ACQ4PT_047515 [Festuca glaucescens]
MAPPWSELPEDILALIFARFFFPVDGTAFQSVCRSWRSAARPPPRQLPWIMLPVGGFLNPSDRVLRRLVSFPNTASCAGSAYHNRLIFSFPKNTRCVGSTDCWIAVDCADAENGHTYYLHDEFSCTTLSLPELDAAIGHVSDLFRIRKVLLRSTTDDVIAIMTNHRSCPIILTQLGKGVWLPKSYATPLSYIIDVVFSGDRLYGITQAEDLVFLDIASDGNGVPTVMGGKCVIGKDFVVWSNQEDEDDDDDDDDDSDDDDDDQDDDEIGDEHPYDLTKMTKADMIPEATQYINLEECPHEVKYEIETMWYLIESCGKLLMVRRQVLWPANGDFEFTYKVEVFEADIRASTWVPLSGGLGGQALFISRRFCKSVAACNREIQKDVLYFVDTDDVFNMRSQSVSASRTGYCYSTYLRACAAKDLTWVFPPELVA